MHMCWAFITKNVRLRLKIYIIHHVICCYSRINCFRRDMSGWDGRDFVNILPYSGRVYSRRVLTVFFCCECTSYFRCFFVPKNYDSNNCLKTTSVMQCHLYITFVQYCLARRLHYNLWYFEKVATIIVLYSREDGLCGPGKKAPNGKDAKCQHIPPFPTCCQSNGHCGWDCDNGK